MRAPKVLILLILLSWPASVPVTATGRGETCDGVAAIRCDAGLWCQHPAGQCSVPDAAGKCIKAADVCTQDYNPVRACDGETYGNQCMASVSKVEADYIGECTN